MITELRAQNFKSWKDTSALQFAPLTGFFGANSSGKSSILQVLLMLKQTAELPPHRNEPLYFGDEDTLADLASYSSVIHLPLSAPSLGISVSWTLPKKVAILNICELDSLSFYFNFYNASVGQMRYKGCGHVFEIRPDGPRHCVTTPEGTELVQSLFRCYGIRGASARMESIFSVLEKAFEDLSSRIHYLGPVREYSAPTPNQIRSASIDNQIPRWLRQLKLIDSYHFRPLVDVQQQFPLCQRDGKKV